MKFHILNDKSNESGFTLIEVLVALAIFSIVIAGVIEVFVNSNKAYLMQDDIASMQQNIRIAKMFIERDIRMAQPVNFSLGAGENGSDTLTIHHTETLDNLCGDEDLIPDDDINNPCSLLEPLFTNDPCGNDSSEVMIKDHVVGKAYAMWQEGCYCGDSIYSPKNGYPAKITSKDDPDVYEYFYVTHVQNSGHLQNHKITIDGETIENKVTGDYPPGSKIEFDFSGEPEPIPYEIKNGELLRQGQVIADHVEDLQFAFCGDFNEDGFINPESEDDWYSGELIDNDLPEDAKELVKYIRITILGKTDKEHNISSFRPGIEDHEKASENDKFNRRLLQTTVQLRNASL